MVSQVFSQTSWEMMCQLVIFSYSDLSSSAGSAINIPAYKNFILINAKQKKEFYNGFQRIIKKSRPRS
jgi:hypothetical protein